MGGRDTPAHLEVDRVDDAARQVPELEGVASGARRPEHEAAGGGLESLSVQRPAQAGVARLGFEE